MKLALSILFCLYLTGSPAQAGSCMPNGLCEGDKTWVYIRGELQEFTVKSVRPGKKVELEGADPSVKLSLEATKVPSSKTGKCVPGQPSLCVGKYVRKIDEYRNEAIVKILAAADENFMVVREAGQLRLLRPDSVTEVYDHPCTAVTRICEGDKVFVDEGNNFKFALVSAVNIDNDTFLVDGVAVKLEMIARTDQKNCPKDSKGFKLCPGMHSVYDFQVGTLLGKFSDNTLVFAGNNGLARVEATKLTYYRPQKKEEGEIVQSLASIPGINSLLSIEGWLDHSPPSPSLASPRCQEQPGPALADDSPNYVKFENLLKRGTSAPLSDFLILWYPARGYGTDEGAYFFNCLDKPWGHLKGEYNSVLEERCSPDVLYSWGSSQKLAAMKLFSPDDGEWTGPMNIAPKPQADTGVLYLSLSAVGTYFYGKIPVRIKLKPRAPVRIWNEMKGRMGEVISYPWSSGTSDFYIADGSVVESWSYATPEFYDEIVRDAIRVMSGKPGIAYTKEPQGKGADRLFKDNGWDGYKSTEEILKNNLLEMIRMILQRQGGIHYAKGSCRNRTDAYATVKHSYINPKLSRTQVSQ